MNQSKYPKLMVISRVLFSISLISICFYFVLRNVTISNVYISISQANLWMIPLSFCITLASLWFRLQRWKVLIPVPIGGIDLGNKVLFKAMMSGLFADQILPAKGGEFLRAYLLSRDTNLKFLSVLGSVLVEKILDLFSILAICGIAFWAFSLNDSGINDIYRVGILFFISGIIGILFFYKFNRAFKGIVYSYLRGKARKKLILYIHSVRMGLYGLTNLSVLIKSIAFSVLMWLIIVVSFLPLLYAIDYNYDLPPFTIFIVLLFTSTSLIIPSTPGGVGLVQYATYLAMVICIPSDSLELPATAAAVAAFSMLFHPIHILPEVVIGAFMFVRNFKPNFYLRK